MNPMPSRPLLSLFAAAAAASAFALPASALAAGPSAALTLSAKGKSAKHHSISVAPNGVRTLVWSQNQGPAGAATGSDVVATRVSTKTEVVIKRVGGKRKKVKQTVSVVKPIKVFSQPGRFVDGVASATNAAGVTAIAWVLRDASESTVSILTRRINARGVLGPVVTAAPEGSRINELRAALSTAGVTTLVWRANDRVQSWIESTRVSAAGATTGPVEISPAHGRYFDSSIASRPDGSVDVVWRNEDGSKPVAQAVQIAKNGTPGSVRSLSNPANFTEGAPAIAIGSNATSTIVWSEATASGHVLRMTRLAANGSQSATVSLSSVGDPIAPVAAVAPNGVSTVVWTRSTPKLLTHVALIRVGKTLRTSSVVDLGPTRGTADSDPQAGPALAVNSSGVATVVYSYVESPDVFPPPVDLLAIRVDAKGRASAPAILSQSKRETRKESADPDLFHRPIAVSSSNGAAQIAFIKQPSSLGYGTLKLSTW